MLLLAAFSLLGFFRLARTVANSAVAISSTLLLATYPAFFSQSSLAQVDLASAGLIFWGLESYFRGRRIACAAWFSLAALAKETAILVPLILLASGLVSFIRKGSPSAARAAEQQAADVRTNGSPALPALANTWFLLLPAIPLALWYTHHYVRTGYVFGNPEYFRYNVQQTLHPLRVVLALLLRAWQAFGYLHLYVLTLACIAAMMFRPINDARGERPRIDVSVQLDFLAIVVAYAVTLSVVGGAVLARYMLPVVPLVILICVSTVWRRLTGWKTVIGVVAAAFVSSLFVNPPYGFSPEDNLAYRDYIRLHQHAETFLEQKYPNAHVLTAWPASDELTRPYLGYVAKPMPVVKIEDFSAEQLLSASDVNSRFDVALVFSTKYQPQTIFDKWQRWRNWKSLYFGYHVDLAPEAAASILGGNVVYSERKRGQWIGVIALPKIEEASITQ